MKINSYNYPKSSFLSIEKDTATVVQQILKNDRLKKLLHYNVPNALEMPDLSVDQSYLLLHDHKETIDGLQVEIPALIKFIPKVYVDDAAVSYIIVSFDNFRTNLTNPEFRDCEIDFDIICHYDLWYLENGQLRPYKIAAELDSMFNEARLSGIGTLKFINAANFTLQGKEYAGITLRYYATHGEDDKKWTDKDIRPAQDADLEANFDKIFNQ